MLPTQWESMYIEMEINSESTLQFGSCFSFASYFFFSLSGWFSLFLYYVSVHLKFSLNLFILITERV